LNHIGSRPILAPAVTESEKASRYSPRLLPRIFILETDSFTRHILNDFPLLLSFANESTVVRW